MAVLVDTNILLRVAQPSHRALEILIERGEPLLVGVAEFWNAATRPVANNGLGFSIEEAKEELARIEGFFEVISENAASYAAWKALVMMNRVSGVQVHGAACSRHEDLLLT